ncbi:MAG: hypothetical protein GX025_10675 [Clostridiales bacterium]|nr:hypothetical protein [Clostridiales bacterium]
MHSTEPDPNKASYAGIDFDPRATPVTLRRDATPTRLSNQVAELRQLAAQVEFFLRLPEDQQDEFISMDFARCPNCHHIHTVRDGCPCGATAPLTDEEWELYHYTAPSRLRVD